MEPPKVATTQVTDPMAMIAGMMQTMQAQTQMLAEMMANGNEELDCFAGDTQKAISELAARFKVRHLFEMFPRGWLPTPLPCRSLISLPVNAKILSMV